MNTHHGVFVGRNRELAELSNISAKTAAGESWLVLVDGEPGMGKTALVRHFSRQLEGFTRLDATADPHEVDLPGAVLGQVLDQVGPERRRPFPLLLAGDFQNATSFGAGGQLIGLLGDLEKQQPVLIVVDDVQWMDELSLHALLFALRRLRMDRVMVVMTVRTGEGDAREADLRSFARRYERVAQIHVQGLTRTEIADLTVAMLGSKLPDSAVLDTLRATTGGRALYVCMLLAEVPLERLGQVDALLAAPSLIAVVRDALVALPPPARALAEALAVLDARVPLHVAAGLIGLTEAAAATRALEPLLRAGLVEWRPKEAATPVAIRHSLQRDAIYAQLSPARRRWLHTGAAAVVSGSAVWLHRVTAAAGAPDPRLAEQLEAVAADESDRGRHAIAGTHLRWAADLSPARGDRERLLVLAYFAFMRAGQGSRMLSLYQDLEACSPGILRDTALASAMSYGGHAEALDLARRVRRALTADPHPEQLAGYVGYSIPAVFLVWGDARAARELCHWLLALRRLGGEPLSATRGVLAWATLALAGPRAALSAIAEETAVDGFAMGADNAQLIAVRGSIEALDGQLSQALTDLQAAQQHAREGRPIIIGRRMWAYTRWVYFLTGRWDVSPLSAADAPATAGSNTWYDDPFEHLCRIWVPAARGDWSHAERQLDLIRRASLPQAGGGEHLCASIGRAVIAQARGDHDEMYRALERLRDSPPTSHDHAQTARWWLPLLAEAEIGTGRLAAADATLQRLGDTGDVPYLYLQTSRLRGQLTERLNDPGRALEIYRTAAESAITRDDAPFHRAMLDLAYGRLLRLTGQRRRAGHYLQSAAATLAVLGAAPVLQRCRKELATCGLHAPRQRTLYATRLTEREREIAQLIGMGKTNGEISAELFVSIKTVEYHLANIYLKLNISGRRELRNLIQAEQQPERLRGVGLSQDRSPRPDTPG